MPSNRLIAGLPKAIFIQTLGARNITMVESLTANRRRSKALPARFVRGDMGACLARQVNAMALPVSAGPGMAYLLVFPERKELYAVSDNKMHAAAIDLDGLLAPSENHSSTRTLPSPRTSTSLEAHKSRDTDSVAGYVREQWSIQLTAIADQPQPGPRCSQML